MPYRPPEGSNSLEASLERLLAEIQAMAAAKPAGDIGQAAGSGRQRAPGRGQFAEPTPEHRGFLLPLKVPRGGYTSEPGTLDRFTEGLAVPGIIHGPYKAANALLDRIGYHPGQDDEEGVRLAFEASGISAAGALASRPSNALMTGIARRELPTVAASRLQRAETMGFDTSERLYHGTNRGFKGFDLRKAPPDEQAVWLTPDAEVAGHFAVFSARGGGSGTRVLPLHIRGRQKVIDRDYLQREYGDEFSRRSARDPDFASPLEGQGDAMLWVPEYFQRELRRAKREGYDAVRFRNVEEGMGPPTDQIAVFDPANVRSTNARFNPRYRASNNLLSANPAPAAPPASLPAAVD